MQEQRQLLEDNEVLSLQKLDEEWTLWKASWSEIVSL